MKPDTHGNSHAFRSDIPSFLLTKFAAKFSAIDAPDTNYSLVGSDHTYGKESYIGLPQILLSEIVEYSQSRFVPEGFLHLVPYKIWHAWTMTDYGYSQIAEKFFLPDIH